MVSCLIVAAGSGKRMGGAVNKVFMDLDGYPILFHSIMAFENNDEVDEIILVMKADEIAYFKNTFEQYGFKKIAGVIPGGRERFNSVQNGVAAVGKDCEILLIHDGARPYVSQRIITDAVRFARRYGAACPGIDVKDTIKVVGDNGFIQAETDRSLLKAVQTPQAFAYNKFAALLKRSGAGLGLPTDDTSVFFLAGEPVFVFPGEEGNIKITTPMDLPEIKGPI